MTREEIVNNMTLQEAIQIFKSINCYGTMDIAKAVILKALEQKESDDNIYKCPCGYGWDINKAIRFHYCPNCGRKSGR